MSSSIDIVRFGAGLVTLAAILAAGEARAQSTSATGDQGGQDTYTWTALSHQSNALGGMGGLRDWLGEGGMTFNLTETSEVLGNLTGGVHTGFDYDGLTTATLQLDTSRAFGWDGGLFNVSGLQLHGRNLSTDNLSDLQTASGIEAPRDTRLWELWYQQATPDKDFDVKIGQQSIDQEFIVSTNSGLFVNTMAGWPALPSYDMPSGGPAYPLSAPGIRLRATPNGSFAALVGVFNGDPAANDTDNNGLAFRTNDGQLVIGEIQYSINQPAAGDMVQANGSAPGLPGTYKLGFWYNTNKFDDEEFDTSGVSLGSPASNGNPRQDSGNYSIYGVVDQMIWEPDPNGTKSLNAFLRVMGAPDDRNLLSFSANGGFTLKAPFQGRDSDTVGIDFGYVKVSDSLAAEERTAIALGTAAPGPIQGSETLVELTYQYQFTPWWQLQPDLQYVFNPGGGIANPSNPSERVGDEFILGMRTNITF
jgi:porin